MSSIPVTCMRCHHDWEVYLDSASVVPLANLAWALTLIRCPQCNAPNDEIYRRRNT